MSLAMSFVHETVCMLLSYHVAHISVLCTKNVNFTFNGETLKTKKVATGSPLGLTLANIWWT